MNLKNSIFNNLNIGMFTCQHVHIHGPILKNKGKEIYEYVNDWFYMLKQS